MQRSFPFNMSDLRDKFDVNMHCTKSFSDACIDKRHIFKSMVLFVGSCKAGVCLWEDYVGE